MKDTLSNKKDSFNASLKVADDKENLPIWQNKAPLAFGTKLELTRAAVTALGSAGAEQSAPTGGSTDALRLLRKDFETALHPLARATFRYLKDAGNLEDAAKVDITPSDLHDARAGARAGIGETVLDLAEPLTVAKNNAPAPGETYGITAANFTKVDDLWSRYSTAVGAPAGKRAKHKALTDALPGQSATTEEMFAVLDDLILQFRGTPAGDRFVDAWFNARRVVDLGRRAAKAAPAPAPAPAKP